VEQEQLPPLALLPAVFTVQAAELPDPDNIQLRTVLRVLLLLDTQHKENK
jgi:hypothetical protein